MPLLFEGELRRIWRWVRGLLGGGVKKSPVLLLLEVGNILQSPHRVPPPLPLYKLRPCPSYRRRRDRNGFVRNSITCEM